MDWRDPKCLLVILNLRFGRRGTGIVCAALGVSYNLDIGPTDALRHCNLQSKIRSSLALIYQIKKLTTCWVLMAVLHLAATTVYQAVITCITV